MYLSIITARHNKQKSSLLISVFAMYKDNLEKTSTAISLLRLEIMFV